VADVDVPPAVAFCWVGANCHVSSHRDQEIVRRTGRALPGDRRRGTTISKTNLARSIDCPRNSHNVGNV
jgi:hypothetical protein